MSSWKIGDVRVTRVREIEAPGLGFVVPKAVPENLRRIPWLAPPFVTDAWEAIASVHALVVESRGKRILVDTCIGNHKKRPIPAWNDRDGPFLQDLEAAGFPAESIDLVVATHLHVDHVGWNTRLEGGVWVPTFPNARHWIVDAEWEHWSRDRDPMARAVIEDSVRPVVEAGRVDFVASETEIDENLSLEPTPGHTPGHVSVRIRSGGDEAIITGDLLHHPAQIAEPEWASSFDADPILALRTRRRFLERHADGKTLVIGTHFAGTSAGRIVSDGGAYRFEARSDGSSAST